eukprot:3507619-Prymnesium_polylepis.2
MSMRSWPTMAQKRSRWALVNSFPMLAEAAASNSETCLCALCAYRYRSRPLTLWISWWSFLASDESSAA